LTHAARQENKVSKSNKLLKIEQTGSPIRRHHSQRETLIGLGLNRIGRVAQVPDTPETRGMLRKVKHLVRVLEAEQ
jgi:large subunit ribosomal protein L30